MEKRRLGRGLEALIGSEDAVADSEVPLDRIDHNPYQPRKTFDKDELATLANSVRLHGILQPIVVRRIGEQYQLIAGERRLRAAQDAGLTTIPVRVVDFSDQQVLEAALAENIHRTDLNPIEKALGFKDYCERFSVNHEQLSQRLGLARSTVTNLINLLDLAPEVQEGVRLNQITEAHAKLLKSVKKPERQVAVFKQIVAMGLSVKAADTLIREQKEAAGTTPSAKDRSADTPSSGGEEKTNHVRSLEDELRQKLAAPVDIQIRGKDRGQIVLGFQSNDDFMRLIEQLRK